MSYANRLRISSRAAKAFAAAGLIGGILLPAAAQAALWESHVPYVHAWGNINGRFTNVADYSSSGALPPTGPFAHYGGYTMPSSCNITSSYCLGWPAYGVFMAYVTSDQQQWAMHYGYGFCSGICQYTQGGNTFYYDNRLTTGSIPTVTPGTDITLEWSCQYKQDRYSNGGCTEFDAFNNCSRWVGGSYMGSTYYYSSASGSGFAAGPLIGTVHVAPQVTTTYTLTCNPSGGAPVRTLPITITVGGAPPPPPPPPPPSDACPILTESAGEGFILYSGATRKIDKYGITYCVTNYNGNAIFIPAKIVAELQSFGTAPAAFGVVKF